MKVLFAVDGSEHSLAAVAQVGSLLTSGRDEVALFCAPPSKFFTSAIGDQALLERARRSLVDAIFAEARKRLPEPLQAQAETIISDQHDARNGIPAAAEAWQAGLIVVGARGLGRFERLLLGSVSRAVVHSARIPVWVSRASGTVAGKAMQVMLTCEDPQVECKHSRLLDQLNWPAGSVCHVLSAIPSLFAGKVPDWLQQQARSPDVEDMVKAWAREHDEEIATTRVRLEAFTSKLPAVFSRYESEVAEGEPSAVVLSKIAAHKIDVVMVGAHQKTRLSSALLGSTSDAVLNHAPCSVVVVPIPARS
jgi:nucleotide-binding universal stress UspA family protein